MNYIKESDAYTQYDDMLNEVYGVVDVGVKFPASWALRTLDPIVYECGFDAWLERENLTTDSDDGETEDQNLCVDCEGCGKIYKHNDPRSGQWVPCPCAGGVKS